MPITFVLVFVFPFGKAVAGDWHAYLQFVLPGIAVQALLFVTLNIAVTLNTDVHTGSSSASAVCPSPARPR
jgi:oleandomycin transport system permease protein